MQACVRVLLKQVTDLLNSPHIQLLLAGMEQCSITFIYLSSDGSTISTHTILHTYNIPIRYGRELQQTSNRVTDTQKLATFQLPLPRKLAPHNYSQVRRSKSFHQNKLFLLSTLNSRYFYFCRLLLSFLYYLKEKIIVFFFLTKILYTFFSLAVGC